MRYGLGWPLYAKDFLTLAAHAGNALLFVSANWPIGRFSRAVGIGFYTEENRPCQNIFPLGRIRYGQRIVRVGE